MSSTEVFVGLWTDQSNGKVLGASLTVPDSSGRYILSGTATFIGIVAGFAWALVVYFLHNTRVRVNQDSDLDDADLLHLQQQVSLRNSQSTLSTLFELLCIGWVWTPRSCFCCKRRVDQDASRVKRRTLPLILCPLVIWGAFTAAGTLSSSIAKPAFQSSGVLVKRNKCGLWTFNTSSPDGLTAEQLKLLNDTLASRTYARGCYSQDLNSVNPTLCSFYTVQNLTYTRTQLMGQCPFGSYQSTENLNLPFTDGECDTPYNVGAHFMSTDLLDSHEHLGINAPPQNRVHFQKNTTCSPISLTNRTAAYIGPSADLKEYMQYEFGPLDQISNYTYLYSPSTPQDLVGYQITAVVSNSLNQGWSPIPQMIRADGDTSLFFLAANSVYYAQQILDPIFLALYSDQVSIPSVSSAENAFLPYNPVSTIGCVDQYLIINPKTNASTGPMSQTDLAGAVQSLNFNVAQTITAQRIIQYLSNSDTYSSVFSSGAAALKSSDHVLNFKCLSLPNDQWRTEVEGWFETSLAKIQAYAVEFPSTTGDFAPHGSLGFPGANASTNDAWEDQCNNQKIQSTGGYQTFSFFGLIFTFSIGSTIVIFQGVLKIVNSFRGKHQKDPELLAKSPRDLMYAVDEKFQLQRIVLEEGKYGTWHGYNESTPWSTNSPVVPGAFWKRKVLRGDVELCHGKSLHPNGHFDDENDLRHDESRQSNVLRNEPVERNENGNDDESQDGQGGGDQNEHANETELERHENDLPQDESRQSNMLGNEPVVRNENGNDDENKNGQDGGDQDKRADETKP